jgi:exodeoxyribonuclease VII large subunit
VSILLAPALVQGEGAADSVRRAVAAVNKYDRALDEHEKIDVIIVGRGGGSAEDLWAFNDEALARALRASEIPVISAVGHEIDWTIADLVSDIRAATPSAAAEIVAGREEDILFGLQSVEATLGSILDYKILEAESALNESASRLQYSFSSSIQRVKSRFADITSRLTPATLMAKTASHRNELARLEQRKITAIEGILASKNEEMRVNVAKLDALSPLAVLTRGYSITQGEDGKVLRDSENVKPGDKLNIRLERGKLNAEVLSVE